MFERSMINDVGHRRPTTSTTMKSHLVDKFWIWKWQQVPISILNFWALNGNFSSGYSPPAPQK